MAGAILFKAYYGPSPQWNDIGANRLIFCGSRTVIGTMIAAATFQDGTHVGSGTPGSDICGTNHANNVKWVNEAPLNTKMSLNGAANTTINDTALGTPLETGAGGTSCTLRVEFNDPDGDRKIQNGRFYAFDNSVVTNRATGVDLAVFEGPGNSAQWTHLNDDTTSGHADWASGGIGGDNTSEFLGMGDRSTARTNQYWFYALSASPETAGGKSAFALGVYVEYYA